MNTARNHLLRFLCASGLIIVIAAALNFVVDPLQLFRPARLFAAMYSPDSRMQDAGLIRSQDFDTVFMGTSLAIHFRQSDIDRLLGVRSVKLAMTGSNSREQSFVLAAALERRPQAGDLANGRLDLPRCAGHRPGYLSSGRSLPAQCKGHRGVSFQRRHGARVAVDTGAVDSAV
jgi:hypothetical protein